MAYWMMKSEPGEYSYQDLEKDGWTYWDGVHNYQARNNMKQMGVGDWVLIYHSVTEKVVAGVAKVIKSAYPDPEDDTGKWVWVDIEPVAAFKKQVSLAEVKANPDLVDIALVRQSRLSVMPLTKAEFETLLTMGETPLKIAKV